MLRWIMPLVEVEDMIKVTRVRTCYIREYEHWNCLESFSSVSRELSWKYFALSLRIRLLHHHDSITSTLSIRTSVWNRNPHAITRRGSKTPHHFLCNLYSSLVPIFLIKSPLRPFGLHHPGSHMTLSIQYSTKFHPMFCSYDLTHMLSPLMYGQPWSLMNV